MANSDRYYKSNNSISTYAALQSPLKYLVWYSFKMTDKSFNGDFDPSNRSNHLYYLKYRDKKNDLDYLNKIDWGRTYNTDLSCYKYDGNSFFASHLNMPVPVRAVGNKGDWRTGNTLSVSNLHGHVQTYSGGTTVYLQYAAISPHEAALWSSTSGIPSSTTSRTLLKAGAKIVIFDLCAGGGGGGGGYYKTATFQSTSFAGGQGGGSGGSFLLDISKYSSGIKLVVGSGGTAGSIGGNGGNGGDTTIYNASDNSVIISMYGGKGGASGQKNTSDTCSQVAGSQRSPGGVVNETAGACMSLYLTGSSFVTGSAGGRGGRARKGLVENGTCSETDGSNCTSEGTTWSMKYNNSGVRNDMITPVTCNSNSDGCYFGLGRAAGYTAIGTRFAFGGGAGASIFGGHALYEETPKICFGFGCGGDGGSSGYNNGNWEEAGNAGNAGVAIMYY